MATPHASSRLSVRVPHSGIYSSRFAPFLAPQTSLASDANSAAHGTAAPASIARGPAKPAGISAAAWQSIMQQVQRELYAAEPDRAGVLQAYNQGQRMAVQLCGERPEAHAGEGGGRPPIQPAPLRLWLGHDCGLTGRSRREQESGGIPPRSPGRMVCQPATGN